MFKEPSEENGGFKTDIMHEDETWEKHLENDQIIRCSQCLNTITRMIDRIVIDGAHQHTFANPHGIIFEIACFGTADGCRHMGPGTDEFTWFKGYVWKIAVCGKCLLHLGWQYFSSGSGGFYGLIVDRLIYPT